MNQPTESVLTCPVPHSSYAQVLLAHGGGGLLTHRLIEQLFRPAFANRMLDQRHDGAVVTLGNQRLALTTDSYVVRPLFFPGGDIGTLAVNGTVNDLAMCGAKPLFLSTAFVIEEGLPLDTLGRIVASMSQAAAAAGVQIVTGDTKVVDRGKGDGIYINTTGIGIIEHGLTIAPSAVRPGDVVLLSGDIGRHGMAIMAVREGLQFESAIASDCAPLAEAVLALIAAGVEVHCLRDLTRGGLATALIEIAEAGGARIHIEEATIAIPDEVRGACEILGLDPLYVANEGRFVCLVPQSNASAALEVLRRYAVSAEARAIGNVGDAGRGRLTMTNRFGTNRVLDMLTGEQLPRIC